jgi:hypothetical protein
MMQLHTFAVVAETATPLLIVGSGLRMEKPFGIGHSPKAPLCPGA